MQSVEFVVPSRFECKSALPTDYTWAAQCQEVYDGDTITCVIDLGLQHFWRSQVRLAGLNAPEMRGADVIQGERSRDYLRSRLLGKWCVLHCGRASLEKYGRVLARVFVSEGGRYVDLCREMVEKGMAREYLVERDPTAAGLSEGQRIGV